MGVQVFSIAAFYKFTKISLLSELQTELYEFLDSSGIKGTVLLAEEGINGTVSGSSNSIDKFKNFLFEKDLLNESDFKVSYADFMSFGTPTAPTNISASLIIACKFFVLE